MKHNTTSRMSSLALLVAAGALVLAACGSPSPEAPSQKPASAAAVTSLGATQEAKAAVPPEQRPSSEPGALRPASLAADFEIEVYTAQDAFGGNEVRFSEILGQGKPVVLNYWAGLCPPCRAEMPAIQEVATEYRGKVTVFGLDIGPFVGLGSSEDGKALVKRLGITYATGTTIDPAFLRQHPPQGMPTTLFMSADGAVVKKWTGLITKDQLAKQTRALLQASGDSSG